ncbi:NUMOD4 motif-containing HNH endonuclease [Mycobacterium malmoense]|uniref:NUMOD4 motif-containing HNH endonuclease n=1 Tax=Mycobacterium malmoense TaxID=1780 RepID=UPI0009F9C9FB|nr:NUMOD4 motif-containing HNH endonuclease [Mycobacterium malmoense]
MENGWHGEHSQVAAGLGRTIDSAAAMTEEPVITEETATTEESVTTEEWRTIAGFPSYEVSNLGRVRTKPHIKVRKNNSPFPVAGRIRKLQLNENGYLIVHVQDEAARKRALRVNVIVAEAFIGPRPAGMHVCHNNGIATDNRAENLRYDTLSNNQLDTVRHGTHFNASKTHCKRNHPLTPENVYVNPTTGGRRCLQCVKERNQPWLKADAEPGSGIVTHEPPAPRRGRNRRKR